MPNRGDINQRKIIWRKVSDNRRLTVTEQRLPTRSDPIISRIGCRRVGVLYGQVYVAREILFCAGFS